jgi:hypothetical protein
MSKTSGGYVNQKACDVSAQFHGKTGGRLFVEKRISVDLIEQSNEIRTVQQILEESIGRTILNHLSIRQIKLARKKIHNER